MGSKRERIIQLVERISALRAELKRLDREFAELVPDDTIEVAAVVAPEETGQSMPAKVLALLGANPGRAFNAQDISKAVRDDNLHLIRGTLFRLTTANKIRKLGRGQYSAVKAAEVAA